MSRSIVLDDTRRRFIRSRTTESPASNKFTQSVQKKKKKKRNRGNEFDVKTEGEGKIENDDEAV